MSLKKYEITKAMFPGFIKLYEYTNYSPNNLDEFIELDNMTIRAMSNNVPITYNENQRIMLNKLRIKFIQTKNPLMVNSGVRTRLGYYSGVVVPIYENT